jgi:hypothetical protein
MKETATKEHWGERAEVMKGLAGTWLFDRVIEGYGTMQGLATFSPLDQGRLAYREEGNLRLVDGTEFQAEREYIFGVRVDGFDVFFKENPPRLFHEISLSSRGGAVRAGSADHLCGPDTYKSTYTFLPDGRFIIQHIVSGPRKDYTMTTTYSRS